jgi:hypothetical protein
MRGQSNSARPAIVGAETHLSREWYVELIANEGDHFCRSYQIEEVVVTETRSTGEPRWAAASNSHRLSGGTKVSSKGGFTFRLRQYAD